MKNKKRKKWWLLLFVPWIVIGIFVIIDINLPPEPVYNQRMTGEYVWRRYEMPNLPYKDYPYYNSLEESIVAFRESSSLDDDTTQTFIEWDNLVFQKEFPSGYILAAFPADHTGGRPIVTVLYNMLFEVKDGKISYPLGVWTRGTDASLMMREYTYELIEVAALNVLQSYSMNYTEYANDGSIFYYGASKDSGIQTMKVLGESPTEILTFDYQDEQYYLWYYDNGDEITKILDDNIDLDDCTLEEVISCLDISVE